MRTSSEVFHRILFDSGRFDRRTIVIGYFDRFCGLQERPLVDLVKGDVSDDKFLPWHRVEYFRDGTVFLWHRGKRIDRVFRSTTPSSAEQAPSAAAPRASSASGPVLIFFDTKPCKFHQLESGCSRGARCPFRHGSDDRRMQPRSMSREKYEREQEEEVAAAAAAAEVAAARTVAVEEVSEEAAASAATPNSDVDSFCYDPSTDAWTRAAAAASSASPPKRDSLRILSYNLCFKAPAAFGSPEERATASVDHIVRLDCDLVSLQEVTPSMLECLLADARIRDMYHSSDVPSSVPTPHGVVLLSRVPLSLTRRVADRRLEAHLAGTGFLIVALHLRLSPRARARELEALTADLSQTQAREVIVVGDFNESEPAYAVGHQLVEPTLVPTATARDDLDFVHTIDPHASAFARLNSLSSGRQWSPDRVLVRPTSRLASSHVQVVQDDARLCTVSDHFPLLVTLVKAPREMRRRKRGGVRHAEGSTAPVSRPMRDTCTLEPSPPSSTVSRRTGIILVPENEADLPRPLVRAYRRFFHGADRWAPHVTLLGSGCVAADHLDAFAGELARVLRDRNLLSAEGGFDVVLDTADATDLSRFAFAKRDTLYAPLTESSGARVADLAAATQAALSAAVSRARGDAAFVLREQRDTFTPHMSLATVSSGAPTPKALKTAVCGVPVSFRVRHICLVALDEATDKMQVLRTVPLTGTGQPAPAHHRALASLPAVVDGSDDLAVAALEGIKATVARVVAGPARVEVFGSRTLGLAEADADLDLIVEVHDDSIVPALAAALTGLPAVADLGRDKCLLHLSWIDEATGRRLPIDCMVLRAGSPRARQFWLATQDAGVLRRWLRAAGPNVRVAARMVRRFARSHQLCSQAAGGLPSIGWLLWFQSVLAARPESSSLLRSLAPEQLMYLFLRTAQEQVQLALPFVGTPEAATALSPTNIIRLCTPASQLVLARYMSRPSLTGMSTCIATVLAHAAPARWAAPHQVSVASLSTHLECGVECTHNLAIVPDASFHRLPLDLQGKLRGKFNAVLHALYGKVPVSSVLFDGDARFLLRVSPDKQPSIPDTARLILAKTGLERLVPKSKWLSMRARRSTATT